MESDRKQPQWAKATIEQVEIVLSDTCKIKWNMVWENGKFKLWANFEKK